MTKTLKTFFAENFPHSDTPEDACLSILDELAEAETVAGVDVSNAKMLIEAILDDIRNKFNADDEEEEYED